MVTCHYLLQDNKLDRLCCSQRAEINRLLHTYCMLRLTTNNQTIKHTHVFPMTCKFNRFSSYRNYRWHFGPNKASEAISKCLILPNKDRDDGYYVRSIFKYEHHSWLHHLTS